MDSEGALAFNQEWFLMVGGARRHAGLPPPLGEFPLVFRLRGRWDRSLLDQALQTLAARHSVFRTVYKATDWYAPMHREMLLRLFMRHGVFIPGIYVRRILSSTEIVIVERDAGSASVDDLVAVAMTEPLDPWRPPVRAVVFHMDADTRVLVLVTSHLVCDGWSIRLVVRDFLKIYQAVLTGDTVDLPGIAVDFDEFADSQHRAYSSAAFAADEAFWRRQWTELNGAAIRHAEIPFSRRSTGPEPEVMASGGGWVTPSASLALGQAARSLRLTPYILFRTAMTLALSATLGRQRVTSWANFANRRPGLEHLVGWCSNTHIVTIDVPETGTVATVCQQVATAIREAQGHEAMPLASLWQRIGANLDRHDTRVNFDMWPVRRSGMVRPPGPVDAVSSSFLPRMDLDVRLLDDGERFGLRCVYNRSRYEAAGVATLVSTIAAIAGRIAENASETPSACIRAAADGSSACGEFTASMFDVG